MSKVKFPSLYRLIKSNDIETLESYWQTYPETSVLTRLSAGKKLPIMSQAIISSNIGTIRFLIGKTTNEELWDVGFIVIWQFKANKDVDNNLIFDWYSNKLFEAVESNYNLHGILYRFFIELCTCSLGLPENLITDLLSNRVFNLKHELTKIDFKTNFEHDVSNVSARVMELIVNWYITEQIDLVGLYGNFLLYGRTNESVNKMFLNVDPNSKFTVDKHDFYRTEPYEVKISTLVVLASANYKLQSLLANKELGTELVLCIRNIFKENLSHSKFPMFHSIGRAYDLYLSKKDLAEYNKTTHYIIRLDADQIEYFNLFKPVLTESFFHFLNQIGLTDSNKNPTKFSTKFKFD